ncbi:MAG: VCBS repeat-containing protein [bacterium]|nr:VCBS repeat-containing protein [bacterium]
MRYSFGTILSCVAVCALVPLVLSSASAQDDGPVPWTEDAAYRLLVRVSAAPIGDRESDECPARLDLDFAAILGQAGIDGSMAPDSLRVVRVSSAPEIGAEPHDVPFRFDNSGSRGNSFMYNAPSDAQHGELVWSHRQIGDTPSTYAVYFDLADPDNGPPAAPPRPLVGDYDILYQPEGLLSSMYHSRPAPADWNGDGRLDLLVGNILGNIFFHEGTGDPGSLSFAPGTLVTADDTIIDVGYYAAPDVVDWDHDGDLDIICGADGGNVLWFENTGGPAAPALHACGPVMADGEPIVTPAKPCPEMSFYTKDYVPVPDAVDWDGDGDMDLLVGGYVTGLVYFYENAGTGGGLPSLTARGPMQADGAPIDALWQAAPCAVDLDDDGDLDLLVGTLDQRVNESQETPWPSMFYYENTGTQSTPILTEREFPVSEWVGDLTNPRAVDWDNDGDQDLFVGVGNEVKPLRNVGTPAVPRFVIEPSLTCPWVPLAAAPFAVPPVDWDADGDMDFILSGTRSCTYLENVEDGNPPRFVRRGLVEAGGEVISHEFLLGDDHTFSDAFDWDLDGDLDYLLGNSAGDVWYYENVGTPQAWILSEGRRFLLADGTPVHVGQAADTPLTDFASHSGSRSDPAPADYDADGDFDLVVADAYGKVTYFENTGTNRKPIFAPGTELLTGKGRCVLCACDWNGDGLTDLIVSWVGEGVWLVLNSGTPEKPRFERTRRFEHPWIPYPHPYPVDWNRDGDVDLLFAGSYSFLHVAERSYLEGGYASCTMGVIETRP